MEPEQIIPKIVRWGRKNPSPLKKWANGRNNSRSKPKTMYRMLVEQALSFGWLNGQRIRRK